MMKMLNVGIPNVGNAPVSTRTHHMLVENPQLAHRARIDRNHELEKVEEGKASG